MHRYYDFDAIVADLTTSVEQVLKRHRLDPFHALAVCAILETFSSPLKFHKLQGTPLTSSMGDSGIDAYETSRLCREVELIKSPHSLIVNPLMDAIAAAIAERRSLPDHELLRDTLRVFLQKPRLSSDDLASELANNSSLTPAFHSALTYLQEGGVIRRSEDGVGWEL